MRLLKAKRRLRATIRENFVRTASRCRQNIRSSKWKLAPPLYSLKLSNGNARNVIFEEEEKAEEKRKHRQNVPPSTNRVLLCDRHLKSAFTLGWVFSAEKKRIVALHCSAIISICAWFADISTPVDRWLSKSLISNPKSLKWLSQRPWISTLFCKANEPSEYYRSWAANEHLDNCFSPFQTIK